jgi:hypothetical protein
MMSGAPSGNVGMLQILKRPKVWGPHACVGGAEPGAERL